MSGWQKAATVAELDANGGLIDCTVGGRRIALYAVDDAFYATADLCTHGNASLAQGYLDGHVIECPLHQGLFDVRTGEVMGAPCTQPIRTFPVKRKGDDLFVIVAMDP
jgi:naphthalene 1,2-dioxygenase system ferredoxin subunit